MQRAITYRLPLAGRPVAELVTDYSLSFARVAVAGQTVLEATGAEVVARGVDAPLAGGPHRLAVRAADNDEGIALLFDGAELDSAERVAVPTSRSAWAHACIALTGSLVGLAAAYGYLLRARAAGDAWAMKMAYHMAAWHLLLALTLFPASVWGQRIGIRAVQVVSAVFFAIHLGIGLANAGDHGLADGTWMAALNVASGACFLAAAVYGQRAHADMRPR
jgi:hypothetical protein